MSDRQRITTRQEAIPPSNRANIYIEPYFWSFNYHHIAGLGKENWGNVWYSSLKLSDGRPAAIGLDTCVFHTADRPALLTAYNLQNGKVVQQARVEPWNKQAINQANNV